MASLALVSCSDDGDGDSCSDGLCTVSGTVFNIEDQGGGVAPGVKVYLQSNPTVATTADANGNFTLEVPEGSANVLVTDDADGSSENLWFPTINYEVPVKAAFDSNTTVEIHACPEADASEDAIVNATIRSLDAYLATGGSVFEPASMADAKGALVVVANILDNQDKCAFNGFDFGTEGYDAGTDVSAFGVTAGTGTSLGICSFGACVDPETGYVTAELGAPEDFIDVTLTGEGEMGPSGIAYILADDNFSASTAAVAIGSTNRSYFDRTFDVPFEEGAITVLLLNEVNGAQATIAELNAGFAAGGCATE